MYKKILAYKKYFFYGLSIVFGRGLEYIVLLYAALNLTKDVYGELEFYKKLIELLAVAMAFGLPSLLLTYTRSKNSKIYLSVLSFLFIVLLLLIISPLLWAFDYFFLATPVLFHAVFFNNGILPVFFITQMGSNYASLYKSLVSFLFYMGVFLIIVFHPNPQMAFVIVNYYLIGVGLIFIGLIFGRYKIKKRALYKYYKLFKKLLLSSLTLVVSNFANIMFLYTDIMLLKLISSTPDIDIANYSFALNIANMIILIPLTMVQVDIESIKKRIGLKSLNRKIIGLVLLSLIIIIGFYLLLINTYYDKYYDTFVLFLIILAAKLFQSMSTLHGALILIQKKFKINLVINLSVLIFNIILSYIFYVKLNLFGIALASVITLGVRYLILKKHSEYHAVN